jgi:putative polyketide hydroxylase
VPQDALEPVLLKHLRSLPTAQVRMGMKVTGVVETTEGIRVGMQDVATEASSVVIADYVIAADGAHSAVRTALGIPMHGPDNLRNSIATVFRAPLWDVIGDARHGIYMITDPRVPSVFVPAGRDDRWGLVSTGIPSTNDVPTTTSSG